MSFDLKYRPLLFREVVGQQGTTQVLKRLIQTGQVFQKSYIFAGPSGTGKTTTARILARAMLCPNVTEEGEPCNQCESCREIIEGTSSYSYVEMDAANNSGVDTIRAIVEGIEYHTLGGRSRKIYLLDESHRLSSASIDALLKPMEDNLPGSKDKRLVCLFCTTEPEKLKNTLKARCMTFGIRSPGKEDVVERLEYICKKEGIIYEPEALDMLYAYGKGHVRDMVTALERVSHVGDITVEQVREQLGLGAVTGYYQILNTLRDDLPKAIGHVEEVLGIVDPPAVYEGLAEAALASYRVSLGITSGIEGFVDGEIAREINDKYGEAVLGVADRILGRKGQVTRSVLLSEVVMLHRYLNGLSISFVERDVQPMVYKVTEKKKEEEKRKLKGRKEEDPAARFRDEANDLYPGAGNFVRHDLLEEEKPEERNEERRITTRRQLKPKQGEELRAVYGNMK